MVEKKKYPRIDRGPCIKCEVRKARYAEGTCMACHHLIHAEGVRPPGLGEGRNEKALRIRKERVKQYNKLLGKGFTQAQIAHRWKLDADFLSHYMATSRKMGLDAAVICRRVEPQPPIERRPRPSGGRTNEHGQGWGIKGCNCEPCLAARRDKRGEFQRKYRAEKKRLRLEQQEQG